MARTIIVFFFSAFFVLGCNQPKEAIDEKFEINYLDLSLSGSLQNIYSYEGFIIGMFTDKKFFALDSNYRHSEAVENVLNKFSPHIDEVDFYKNDILLSLDDHSVVVLDSNFKRKLAVERKLNKCTPYSLFVYRDTSYIFNLKEYYSITGDYKLSKIDSSAFFSRNKEGLRLGYPQYSDSLYNVYSCSFGEWGGNVFFQNKQSLKTYSLPAYFNEIFYYQNAYHLIQGIGNWSKYMRIKDPTKLYPVAITASPFSCCNCDSGYKEYFYGMAGVKRRQWEEKRDITVYYDSNRVQTLTTFPLNGNLYSFCLIDSSFAILQHSDSVRYIKSVAKMNKRIRGYSDLFRTKDKNREIIGLNGSYWELLDSAGLDRQINQMGLIVIKGNKIDVFESYSEEFIKAERTNN